MAAAAGTCDEIRPAHLRQADRLAGAAIKSRVTISAHLPLGRAGDQSSAERDAAAARGGGGHGAYKRPALIARGPKGLFYKQARLSALIGLAAH